MTCDGISETEPDRRWITAILSANQAVWDHDFERSQHYLSKTWLALRGLSEDDDIALSTEHWFTTIHPNDIDHVAEEWRRINNGETDVINYKFRQRHNDGRWVWFLSRGRVVRRDAAGLPARIVGTDTDITDIKTVEVESQRMAQRLAVAMEAAGMGRWELNLDTGEAYWDDRMLQILAIEDGQNQRPGRDWLEFIHPDDRDEVYPYLEHCLRNRLDIERDYRLLKADGDTIYIRALAKYVHNAETGPRYYGVNYDITRDKLQAQELENARALLEYESRHDALTKLANRRKLDEVFSEHARNNSGGVSVMHFDIDHFKQINDTLGHDAGDATLKHAADVLRRNVTGNAMVFRVGGDEFVALMFENLDPQDLKRIAEAIIGEMSMPFYYGAQKCAIGTSIGIATCRDCSSGDSSLFIDADLALYEAKKAGRGRYRFYAPSMKEEARRRKKTFDALLAGFKKGEITCFYQPQFDAATLVLSGLEALVRWKSEAFGLLMPHEFLGVAEDMGIVSALDDIVLRCVLRDIGRWRTAGIDVPPISVNVSASRLNDPAFAEHLRALDIPEGMLSFELLESAFLDTRNTVVGHNLGVIGELGIAIEIDDFGSGHASISSLLAVAPARLKIDRALVIPITTSDRQLDLVRNIVGIGHMLGIAVVAEGVESAAHIDALQAVGCDFLQGFGLSRPMDGTMVARFLAESAEARAARRKA